jgi:hypothetical protein
MAQCLAHSQTFSQFIRPSSLLSCTSKSKTDCVFKYFLKSNSYLQSPMHYRGWSAMVKPFFPPQKRRIASFLQAVNVGISSLPPSLTPLGWNNTTDRVSKAISDDGTRLSWSCPVVSPHSAGLECPVFLYGAKTVPPTRAEHQQEPASC